MSAATNRQLQSAFQTREENCWETASKKPEDVPEMAVLLYHTQLLMHAIAIGKYVNIKLK